MKLLKIRGTVIFLVFLICSVNTNGLEAYSNTYSVADLNNINMFVKTQVLLFVRENY